MDDATAGWERSARPLPSGTVTFLFTDIEGSTQRWEHHRDEMQDAVRRHDELLRAAIETHDGHIFKTVGDAFYAAFQLAPRAVQAALDIQRAIQASHFESVGGLAVRIGLHTGNADERGNDYFGPALNRVARLLSIGHGGQTLVSGVTAGLVDGQLPIDAELDDLGMHRLKDLERAEHVYQLRVKGTRAQYPPLRSLDALPNNLPLQVTSFIERDSDIAEITGLLERHRVVTLIGSGGVGKTRISLQVGANLLDRHQDGVWFVELAPLADPALIARLIAAEARLAVPIGLDETEALVALLKSRRMLLILDNCEHLLDAAASIAAVLTKNCPHIAILASSRQGLQIAGEATYRIPSLSLPDRDAISALTATEADRYGALRLFVERAKAANPHFVLTNENAPVVADICRRLDGLALAIELAAARTKLLSLNDLRDRLNERFRMLTGGNRDALPRQQTLQAAIDWSYNLLDAAEKRLFTRVGVFTDGFTLSAATAVAGETAADEFELLEVLGSLVDKSLVVSEPEGLSSRYRMLESTREYARDKLRQLGELQAVEERCIEYFGGLAERIFAEAQALPTQSWFPAAVREWDNFRTVLTWTLTENRRPAVGARMVADLAAYWEIRSQVADELYWHEAALGAPGLPEALVGRLANRLARALRTNNLEPERTLQLAHRALDIAIRTGDKRLQAGALVSVAGAELMVVRPGEARLYSTEALTLARLSGDQLVECDAQNNLGNCASFLNDDVLARTYHEAALAIARRLGDDLKIARSLHNLAAQALKAGDIDGALMSEREAVTLRRPYSVPYLFFIDLAALELLRGDLEGAARICCDIMPGLVFDEWHWLLRECLDVLAMLHARSGNDERAAILVGFIEAFGAKLAPRQPRFIARFRKFVADLQTRTSPEAFARYASRGSLLSIDAVITEARAPIGTTLG